MLEAEGEFTTVYLLSSDDIVEGPELLHPLSCLNADAYIIAAKTEEVVISPVYGFVGDCSPSALSRAWEDLQQVQCRIRREMFPPDSPDGLRLQQSLLIWADFLRPGQSVPDNCDEVLAAGIPVLNDGWVSPSNSLTTALRQSLLER